MARPSSTPTPPRPARPANEPKAGKRSSARKPRWPRSASLSVVRLGLLIGGLIIIADLATQALIQRTPSADDAAALEQLDDFINYILFSVLGVLVVRDIGLMYAGAVAGLFAAILDDIVVTAAALLAPQPPPMDAIEFGFIRNLVIGTLFAGLAGVVYALAQRWSAGGRRPR